jgi:two-component system nitrogen regulation response regulator NtrX
LIESELFGHEKGSFTDAVSSRKGRFELANGGTLFLDEIGDMSLNAQAKVLRVIQEQKLERIGGEQSIDIDVRIVAATNKNLLNECKEGNFRQDLFFRLNVIPIYMPPLRERQEDIELLLFHFLKELGSNGKENFHFDESALKLLRLHSWPGNVRELRNLAERILVMHTGGNICEQTLVNSLQKNPTKAPPSTGLSEIMDLDYNTAKETFEKHYLTHQLAKNDGVINRTAEAIGIYPSNLHAKLRKYKIRTEK